MLRPTQISIPTLVRVKEGALDRLGVYLCREGCRRVIVVVSQGLPSPLADRATASLKDHGVEPVSWVQVPNGVVHTFAPETDEVTFLNLHAPSCGFGAYLRGENPGFDQHEPPPNGGLDPASVVVRTLG